mgnify:CR=1 FL=1
MNEGMGRELWSFDAYHGDVEPFVIAFANSFHADIFVGEKIDEGILKASINEEVVKSLGDFFSVVAGKCDGD